MVHFDVSGYDEAAGRRHENNVARANVVRVRSDTIVRAEVAVVQLELESLAECLANSDSTSMSSELMTGFLDHNSVVATQQIKVTAISAEGCDEGNTSTVAGDACISRTKGTSTRRGAMFSRNLVCISFIGGSTSSVRLKKLSRSTVPACPQLSMRYIRALVQWSVMSESAFVLEKSFERFVEDSVNSCRRIFRLLVSHHPIMVLRWS